MPTIEREQAREARRKREDTIRERLAESKILVEDGALVQGRADSWYHSFKPQNYVQQWFVDEMAIVSLRINRLDRIDRRERDLVMLRAEMCWDSDRAVDAALLGAKLAKNPAVVVEQLQTTPHGCDWLIKRWSLLAYASDVSDGKGWTPEQNSLAYDMLGTPAELRIGKPGLVVDDMGRMVESGSDPATVARNEVVRLKEVRARVAPLDESKRLLTASDLSDGASPELKALRRQESSLHRRLQWFMAQFKYKAAEPRQLHPTLKPEYLKTPRNRSRSTPPTSSRSKRTCRSNSARRRRPLRPSPPRPTPTSGSTRGGGGTGEARTPRGLKSGVDGPSPRREELKKLGLDPAYGGALAGS